jgi:Fe-Mn family superoxide dismutase
MQSASTEQPIDTKVPAEAKVLPLLGVSMWEHAFILDYGLDREAYLKNFWNAVNWNRLAIMLNLY